MCEDKFHDECGVVGIFGAQNAAGLTYYALTSLQHRGQESAGIAVSDGTKIKLHKSTGLVSDVFEQDHFEKLDGNIAVGHVRYATAGGRTIENAQPFMNSFKNGSIALAHNGQLVNHTTMREMLEDYGSTFSSTSDSEVIFKLIVRKYIENGGHLGTTDTNEAENQRRFIEAVKQTVLQIKGSFALTIMTENLLIGVRDPNGIRPLCLGIMPSKKELSHGLYFPNGKSEDEKKETSLDVSNPCDSFILSSETCAIDAVNGQFLRDVEPGEMVVINRDGLRSIKYIREKRKPAFLNMFILRAPTL